MSRGLAAAWLAALVAGAAAALSPRERLPPSSLAVWTGGRWAVWWHAATAPVRWGDEPPVLLQTIKWRLGAPGVEWGELRLAGTGEAHRIRLIAVRLDPRRLRFRLDTAFGEDGRPAWTVERAAEDALFAINAGQFAQTIPWGWVVVSGRGYLAPGQGPLSVGVGFDSSGAVRWIPADSLALPTARGGIDAGFQSYPVLLGRGVVPVALGAPGRGVDLAHRDARAALGQLPDGRLLAAISRFDGAGGILDFVPFGLTTPEMAAVMGALGAWEAVLLDGGISSQLLVRDGPEVRRWRGLRAVPLALVATAPGR